MTTKQQPKTGWYMKQYTLTEVKELHAASNGYFFSKGAMKSFNSVIETIPNMANIFITSEKEQDWHKRRYTLRWFDNNTFEIRTLGPFMGYDSIESARLGRKRWTEIKLIHALQQKLDNERGAK